MSGYFCPVCKMEVANINNHINCPGPNRNSGPFPGQIMGGRGICSKCGKMVNNVAYHESICEKDYSESASVIDPIKELEEENKRLKETVRILSERLSKTSKKINQMIDDSYNDITPDRDDYR